MLPPIPAKRYFTIGEVSELCDVKPHVLRYWEQEFMQLRPMKRRGNRRYYQHHEVLMIRRIRDLLYGQGFTISGARNKLQEATGTDERSRQRGELPRPPIDAVAPRQPLSGGASPTTVADDPAGALLSASAQTTAQPATAAPDPDELRRELLLIRDLLTPDSS